MDTTVDITRRSTPRRRRRASAALAILACATGLMAASAPAHAELSPALLDLLQSTPAGAVEVIVTLSAQVDAAAQAADPVAEMTARQASVEQARTAVAAIAGVPVLSLWGANALGLSAPADALHRVAASPLVARVDLSPSVQISPVAAPSLGALASIGTVAVVEATAQRATTTARSMSVTVLPAPAPLRILGVTPRADGTLLVRLLVDRPALVRAELRSGAAATARNVASAGARTARSGRLSLILKVPASATGGLRVRVTARGAGGRRIGAVLERAIGRTAIEAARR